jgi:tRNA nucleotidyltransferase/poly(A) polymerase
MKTSFFEFLLLKEDDTNGGSSGSGNATGQPVKAVSPEIKLSDNAEFKPFMVDESHNKELRLIVKAFLESDKIAYPGPGGIGTKMTTLDAKGESTPKLKKKTLYLVGGAVRDHLIGKTPKDFDLATDATPEEIELILKHAGFIKVKSQSGKNGPEDDDEDRKLPDSGTKSKVYYNKGRDRSGRVFVIGAKVNGKEFEIATFRTDSKSSDGRTPDKMQFTPDFQADSQRRDFTINSMYIPLTSADGANSKLLDPHGGVHHIKSGDVRFVGSAKDRLEEDQLRALRYIRLASHIGKGNVPPDYVDAIKHVKDLPAVSKERIRDEFLKGLDHPEIDPKVYVKLYRDLGLLNTVFPGMKFNVDDDKDLPNKRDKRLVMAHLLKQNNPADIMPMLDKMKYSKKEIQEILFLINLNNWMSKYEKNDDEFFGNFYDMRQKMGTQTSFVPSLIRQWGEMNDLDKGELGEVLSQFVNHKIGTKGYVDDPESGGRVVNPALKQLFGRSPEGSEFGDGIKKIETELFRKVVDDLRKKKNKKKEE